MTSKPSDQRKFKRYATEVEGLFLASYPLVTGIKFQIIDQESGEFHTSKYSAISKNVGVEGLCFTTSFRLNQGEHIHLEVFVNENKDPVPMEGQVRWSRQCLSTSGKDRQFDTGIKIISVKGQPVSETFEKNKADQVIWSGVLRMIFGESKSQ